MAKGYLPYDIDQRLLLPPDMREWVPEGHLASFVLDVVRELDLSEIHAVHAAKDERGRAGYDPRMMLALLVYGYCVGVRSSRRIEKATHEDVAFRMLAGDQHPDHDCIAAFRRDHLEAISKLFLQVLKLCQKAGLAKMGVIAIDSTKIKANASKHKAMSYDRMSEAEKKLEEEIASLLAEAERVDKEEDAKYGKGKRADELPEELRRRRTRLEKIREAKRALENEAKEKAKKAAEEARSRYEQHVRERNEKNYKPTYPEPQPADPETAKPEPKAQRNFTDEDSRILPDTGNKGAFIQGYNAQVAANSNQVIVAVDVQQSATDATQLLPMVQKAAENTGESPDTVLADAGYFSTANAESTALGDVTLLVPPDRQKHGDAGSKPNPRQKNATADAMRARLEQDDARALYKRRKVMIEPVFGQIKEARGIRQFLLRGLGSVRAELHLIAMTHNLLKLFRAPTAATA